MENKTISLFRAMGAGEFESVIQTKTFTVLSGKSEVKYFGLDFDETLHFADKAFNTDLVAVVEVKVSKSVLEKIGDFTHVDPFLFKHGTERFNLKTLMSLIGL